MPSSVAVLNAVAEEEVPTMVLNTAEEVEHPYRRRLTPLDPGKSLNCPPGHVAHGRGTASRGQRRVHLCLSAKRLRMMAWTTKSVPRNKTVPSSVVRTTTTC